MVPYLYAQVVRCHEGGPTLMRPVKGSYHFLLGDDLLVAPIHRDSLTNTVELPAGRWRYLFDDRERITGPTSITRLFPLDEFPVYVREGAIIPLKVSRAYSGFGDTNSAGHLTWAVWPEGKREFTLPHSDGSGETTLRVDEEEGGLRLQLAGVAQPHVLRIHRPTKPGTVLRDGLSLVEGRDWHFDSQTAKLSVTNGAGTNARYEMR